jgi:acyl-coenzyme A thioesterase PaaI-like protein
MMSPLFKETLGVRAWALKNVFLLYFVKPSILQIDERRCVVRLPLNWRTRNHLRSMYIGALCIGADVAGGLIAFHLMRKSKAQVAFLFKDMKGEFLKRAEADVHFTCEDGPVIQELVRRTIETGERQEATVHVVATVPKKLGDEPVAKFEMTLTLKRRR